MLETWNQYNQRVPLRVRILAYAVGLVSQLPESVTGLQAHLISPQVECYQLEADVARVIVGEVAYGLSVCEQLRLVHKSFQDDGTSHRKTHQTDRNTCIWHGSRQRKPGRKAPDCMTPLKDLLLDRVAFDLRFGFFLRANGYRT